MQKTELILSMKMVNYFLTKPSNFQAYYMLVSEGKTIIVINAIQNIKVV